MAKKDQLKANARALLDNGDLRAAAKNYASVCGLDDRDAESWFMLSGIHGRLGESGLALQYSRKVIELEPGNAAAYVNAGAALHALGRYGDALQSYQQALRLNPALADAHFGLGNLMREQGNFDAAEASLRNAAACNPNHAEAHYYLGNMLKIQGRTAEAIDSYGRALANKPDFSEARWNKLRALPVIYDSEQEIDHWRDSYAKGLLELSETLNLATQKGRSEALRGAATTTNFYLQYQGRDDLELQKRYGDLVNRVMAAAFPQWTERPKMPGRSPDGRIRIGYASAFLRAHNGAVWLLGWLRHRDKSAFEVYCYHTGDRGDDKTEEFRRHCDHFRHIPNNLAGACKQIAADDLHILVYPELGMDAPTMLMAALRLAPVQCVGWGHPITSGLPTMDYWLSSDLMEPANGQDHYSETLVRLPNLAHCYSKQQHDMLHAGPRKKTRADFGLRQDAVIYLCSQSLFKYLPRDDQLFVDIARRVPNAQFVFLAISSVHVVQRFMARIDRAFTQAGLQAKNHCVMLQRQSPEDYLWLNRVADVFLDNPSWSGNNTTHAALDCHLPVVTLPTEFMRGRHSYAILRMLGATDTITSTRESYVETAARLGLDSEWRDGVTRDMIARLDAVYEDVSCVRALEEFYQQAAQRDH